MIQRRLIPSTLSMRFSKDYKLSMKHYTVDEQLEFTNYLLKLCDIYYKEEENIDANKEWMITESERLKKKYGRNYKGFREGQLYKFFNFDIVLCEKEIYSVEEFNNLKNPEEQRLTPDERKNFFAYCCNGLQYDIDRLYLESEPETSANNINGTSKEESKTQKETKKQKIKRSPNDRLTSLTQEQTALLLYFLQQERVILKDEYLNNKDAATAFELLTGYSQNTLRQKLSSVKEYQNKANLKEIHNLIVRLEILLSKALREK